MLGSLEDLHRSAELKETFADDVVGLARPNEAGPHDGREAEAMLDPARRHRDRARARIEAVSHERVRRYVSSASSRSEPSARLGLGTESDEGPV